MLLSPSQGDGGYGKPYKTMMYTFFYSFDHDGLGRYGDPLNPNGDLVAMETVGSVLKEGGLFFLTVPIGEQLIQDPISDAAITVHFPRARCGGVEPSPSLWQHQAFPPAEGVGGGGACGMGGGASDKPCPLHHTV